MSAQEVMNDLAKYSSDADAVFLQKFFKTGPGEYGEGDTFIGVRVPQTRKVCKQYSDLSLVEIEKLLQSPIHEHRLAATIIMSGQYKRADPKRRESLYNLYLKGLDGGMINNWDIIDTSCEYIVGEHHRNTNRDKLFSLAKSKKLWDKRVAIISTFNYIKTGQARTTLDVAELLVDEDEDLVQKAVGWMLREVGKRVDEELLFSFLDKHAATMPRTMLRYACEKLTPQKKQHYYQLKNMVKS